MGVSAASQRGRRGRKGAAGFSVYPVLSRFQALCGGTWHTSCDGLGMNAPFDPAIDTVDTSRRYVRVLQQRADGLVAFEFSIGWPELAVELLLPQADFDAFCIANTVRRLAPHDPAATNGDQP